jgi:abortive infection bacteriophage resistance protein
VVVTAESDESTDGFNEILKLFLVCDEFRNLFLDCICSFEVELGDSSTSLLEEVDDLVVFESKLDVEHFNVIVQLVILLLLLPFHT